MTTSRRLESLVLLLGVASIVAFLIGVAADLHWLRMLSKPVPVLLLAILVATRTHERYGRLVALGLLLCLAGDVLLEIGDRTFLAGVGAFLVGHLFYIAAFVGDDRTPKPWRALPFVLWGGGVFLFLLPSLREVGMAVPVGVYIAVISAMMWRAAARWVRDAGGDVVAAALGAWLFGLSDTLIAVDRFDEPIPYVRYAIILLYWAGQLGIALSALWRSDPRLSGEASRESTSSVS